MLQFSEVKSLPYSHSITSAKLKASIKKYEGKDQEKEEVNINKETTLECEKKIKIDILVRQLKMSLSLLEKDVLKAKEKLSHEQKLLKNKPKIFFAKLDYENFIIKLRRIIYGIQNRREYGSLCESKSRKVFIWLMKLFKTKDKQEHLRKTSLNMKKIVLKIIINFTKDQSIRKFTSHDIKQFYSSQVQQFIESYRLNEEPNIPPLENKSTFQNERQFTCEVSNAPSKITEMIQRKEQFNKKMDELNEKFFSNPTKIEEKMENDERALKMLRLKKYKCSNKECRKELSEKKCSMGNHMILICQNCNFSKHRCIGNQELQKQDYFNNDNISIVALGQHMKYTIERVRKTVTKNNIKQTIQSLGYQPIIKSKVVPGTPLKFVCSYPILSGKVFEQIMNNRLEENYLPLTIKPSSIKEAGLGVFATENIPTPGTLICSYLGEMGIGSVIPAMRKYGGKLQMNNSFFTLGWFKDDILLMAPNLFSNVGRFINYNIPSKCNLKPSLCLLQVAKNKYQLAVFITTTCKILAGEQLFYNYGPEY